jgi:hypothetical protein
VLGSEAEKNQLIVEKCGPLKEFEDTSTVGPRHWGVKYEPVSAAFYAHHFKTKVGTEFGCIQHADLPFLGASPDGINVDPDSPWFGVILEIKNPFTRVITGNPIKNYWVQMQFQMEVMRVNWCHFLETKFVQYDSRAAFDADGAFNETADGKPKGAMIYFLRGAMYEYAYAPWGCTETEFEAWEEKELEVEGRVWVTNLYWKLDHFSCVLVQRNEAWFQAHVQKFKDLWEIILKERENGAWSERLPKKRARKD